MKFGFAGMFDKLREFFILACEIIYASLLPVTCYIW